MLFGQSIIGFLLLKLAINAHAEKHTIEYFLELDLYDHLVICNYDIQDVKLSEILEISQKYNTFLVKWNCSLRINKAFDIENALIYLHLPEINEFTNLLNKKGAQRSLEFNTWLIYANDDNSDGS